MKDKRYKSLSPSIIMKLKIKVISNSSQQQIEEREGIFKIHLKSPPIKGKANEELVEFLSKKFKTKKSNISILRGHTSNIKEIEINGI